MIYPLSKESRIELSMQEYLNMMEAVSSAQMASVQEFHLRID